MKRVLIVEDNEDLAFGLQNNLEIEGYEVSVAADGEQGLSMALSGRPDLIILDLTLPKIDGLRVLREVRNRNPNLPIMLLTARSEEIDKVRGLKLGADDYVTKPFGVMELLARVEALLRRVQGNDDDELVTIGDLSIDGLARVVRRGGEIVELAPRELELLMALVRHRGRVVSRQQLLNEVWGHAGEVVTRTVDTHVAELRRKLEPNPGQPRYILTARKAGYRFADDGAEYGSQGR
jgi:DNA-binding response OmpR family regulator